MPLIPGEIPQQNFEKIRDRIGLIIYQEIENQWSEFNDEDLQAPLPNADISTTPTSLQVYIDRVIPIGSEECPVVNVSFSGAPYENNNPLRSEGVNTFFIDVYAKSKSDDDDDADRLANIKLQKIIGKIAFILRHSYYKTLGFTPGFIGGTKVASIQIADPRNDALNLNGCVMGRVVFEVRATEDVIPIEPRDLQGFYTTVKLFETDKGFVYIDTY
jgi:hypothetical protein